MIDEFDVECNNINFVRGKLTYSQRRSILIKIQDVICEIKSSKLKVVEHEIYVLWTDIIPAIYVALNNIALHSIYFLRFDDGGGSYISWYKKEIQLLSYNKEKNTFLKYFKFLIKIIWRTKVLKVIEMNLRKNNTYLDCRIFYNKKNKFIRNKEIALIYQKVFKKSGEEICYGDIKMFEKCILFNTQCLFESNMTDAVADLKLYEKVIRIAQKYNSNIVLKTHPREIKTEKYENLGIQVYKNKDYSQEEIIANLERLPCCIISIFSSTLLNAKGIFNIPAISMAKLFLKEHINITVKRQLNEYIKMYEGIVEFPDSFEELEQLLYVYNN